ncbi:MAG TPA: hypothetical protein VEH48_00045, partial [Candidatus Nitrosopolaris sp.]|nr:hypothetical protein [Candidatus Nitrosopolaris sp.]
SALTTIIASYSPAGGAPVSCTPTNQTVVTGGWTRYQCTLSSATAPSTSGYIQITQGASDTTAHTFYIDGVQLEQASTASNYSDGTINLNGVISNPVVIQDGANSVNAFQVQNAAGNNFILADTTTATLSLGNTGIASTIQIGNTTGAVTQTIYIGNNATASSVTNVTIGSTIGASTTTIDSGTGNINLNPSGTSNTGVLVKPGANSTAAFQVQPAASATAVLAVDTTNNVVTISSGTSNVAGLKFGNLTSANAGGTQYTGILGLDTSGNIGLSQASVSLTSPALAYWDGLNDPTTSSQSYPLASVSGTGTGSVGSCSGTWAPAFVSGSGEELTPACTTTSGSINWSFSQVSFEETQFQFKAGGGTHADSTWFYSYADGVPTTEYGAGGAYTQGYLIYFSEWHHCVGIAWGPYTDGNQCGSGGGANPLTSASLWNIDDNNFHNVDIQLRYNVITVRWDGNIVLNYTDTFGRTLSNQDFGFGSRTGGNTNIHYIKGLLVTKLGSDPSRYNIDTVSPLASGLYWNNSNTRLGISTSSPDSTLEVDGTASYKTVVINGTGVSANNYVYQGSGSAMPACTSTNESTGYTASTTVTGAGTSFPGFTSAMVGDTITLPDGVQDTITGYTNSTTITVSGSRIECEGSYTVLTPALIVSGTTTPTISLGATGTSSTSSTTHIGDTSGSTGTQAITIGSSANTANSLTLEAGTGTTALFNGATAHTIQIGTGAAIQTITIGSQNSTSDLTLQGGVITTTNNQGGVDIGGGFSTSDTNLIPLVLDSTTTYSETANTCTATANDGALYFNSNTSSMAIRACINGGWEDVVTTSGLGILTYGIVPDSGTTPGDLAGVNAADASKGPCHVYMGSVANSVRWTGCTMYSQGRKQIIAAQATNYTTSITTTGSAYQNLCIFTAGSGPSFGTASTTWTSATVPSFSPGSPAVCLATIKEISGGSGIGVIYDTRVFTDSTKAFVSLSTAVSPGFAVKLNGTIGQSVPTAATTDPFYGVVAIWSGTTQTTAINGVVVTHGPIYVTASAGSVGAYVKPTATSGVVNTSALVTTAQTDIPYTYLGLAQSPYNAPGTQCSTTANADTCRGSILVDVNIR